MDHRILLGDCLDVLAGVPDDSIRLIVTSPPYAERRKTTYGGIPADQYVDWFIERSAQFKRVLMEDGTFILNIKEHVEDGERHDYVLHLLSALRKQGWKHTETFIWHKTNAAPGKWPTRFRDCWEFLFQFNKSANFVMNQEAVMVPIGSWAKGRLEKPSKNDGVRQQSSTKSGFGRKIANWQGRDKVYPTNLLTMAAECSNRGHPAAFPVGLPEWFIKLFSNLGDTILDPFAGSGTTGVAAKNLGRSYIGIDLHQANVDLGISRLRWTEGDFIQDLLGKVPTPPETPTGATDDDLILAMLEDNEVEAPTEDDLILAVIEKEEPSNEAVTPVETQILMDLFTKSSAS